MPNEKAPIGSFGWFDLTTNQAVELKSFYEAVVGWESSDLSMGSYSDYVMSSPETKAPVAGVCHARGANAELPPQWLLYVYVKSVEASIKQCVALGGTVIAPIRVMEGQGRYCVIQDPAGAVLAIFEQE
mgnify:CR=1 FL=1